MSTGARNVLGTVCAAVAVFALAVLLGLRLTPPPRTRLDYLVIGSAATFLMLGVVFGMALALWIRPRGLLWFRRKKGQAEQPGGGPGSPA